MKAGLMEIADVFVVNKVDRPGADQVVQDLRLALQLREGQALRGVPAHHGVDLKRLAARGGQAESPPPDQKEGEGTEPWSIPVVKTVAQTGEGVAELVEAIDGHRRHLEASGELEERRKARAAGRVRDVVSRELQRITWSNARVGEMLEEGVESILQGTETPYSLAGAIVKELLRSPAQ
jgi:LAO/AO transport system kinase